MSSQYSLPPGLLASLCFVESRHNVSVIHYNDGDANSYGVCQIKLATARELGFRGTPEQLMQPNYNIKYAAKFLHRQILRYHGNVSKAVIAYNRGHAGDLTTTTYQMKVFKQWRIVRNDSGS